MKHTYYATLLDGKASLADSYRERSPETAAKLLAERAVEEGKASHRYPVRVSVEWASAEHVGIQAGKKEFSCTVEMMLHAYVEEVS